LPGHFYVCFVSAMDEEHHHGAFFGRRKGHPLRTRQAELFATLFPRLALDLTSPSRNLHELFPLPIEDVHLEIGFGGGEHLIGRAKANPHIGFIGAEPFVNGMAKALVAIDENRLTNIRLHHADAVALLDWLPQNALGRIDLLYPDPWPKRRHWKRRFVNEDNIARLARVLRPGGEFRFASDWANYSEWTLARMTRSNDFVWTAQRADDWRKPWSDFTPTRYEAKAVREGRTSCYLQFRRI
jgi:tRNA (guanine-N7-)-methyltransferase